MLAKEALYETRHDGLQTPMHFSAKLELDTGLICARDIDVEFNGFKYVAACSQQRKPTLWTNFLVTRLVYGGNIPSTPEDINEHSFESRPLLSPLVCMPPLPRQQIWSWRCNDLGMKIFVLH